MSPQWKRRAGGKWGDRRGEVERMFQEEARIRQLGIGEPVHQIGRECRQGSGGGVLWQGKSRTLVAGESEEGGGGAAGGAGELDGEAARAKWSGERERGLAEVLLAEFADDTAGGEAAGDMGLGQPGAVIGGAGAGAETGATFFGAVGGSETLAYFRTRATRCEAGAGRFWWRERVSSASDAIR